MDPVKIHSVLLEEMTLSVRDLETLGEPPLPVIVRLRTGRALALAETRDATPGMQVERRLDFFSAVAGTATRAEVEALSESDAVEFIWYDQPVYALLDQSVAHVGVPQIWSGGNEGAGVKLCIVDTGMDANHPDLLGRVIAEQDFTGEGLGDLHGHGTHVASTAAGSGVASSGRYRGVAPRALLLSAKVLRGDGSGRMSLVMAGLEWAVEQGAQVINVSLGARGNCDGTDATSVACDAAMAAGVVVVVAAGNEGPGVGSLGAPGCARQAITVGATTRQDTVADFSSRGPTLDGRPKPDIVLPGADIVAARATGTTLGDIVDERYTRMSGSSMAAPHAAGIAALMMAANPALTPTQVKGFLGDAARSIGLDANQAGRGLVMATRAVELARAAAPTSPTPTPSPSPTPAPTPAPTSQPDGCFAPVVRMLGRK